MVKTNRSRKEIDCLVDHQGNPCNCDLSMYCEKPKKETVCEHTKLLSRKMGVQCIECGRLWIFEKPTIKGKETVLYTKWECPNLPRMHMVIYDATQSQIDEHLKQCKYGEGKETSEEKISHDWTDTPEGKILRDFDNVPVNKMKDFIARSLKDYKRELLSEERKRIKNWVANNYSRSAQPLYAHVDLKELLSILADLSAE